MVDMTEYIAFRQTACLIVAGFFLSTLFGQGTHFHSIFDHLFDHGDIHVYVHAHSHSSDHEHEHGSSYDLEDSHNHPISSLTLKSIRVQTSKPDGIQQSQSYLSVVPAGTKSAKNNLIPAYLDLPPPDLIPDLYLFYSFSLRAPPVG